MPIVLALGCAVLWGTADFAGGTASRRSPSTTVLLWSSLVALAALLVAGVVSQDLVLDGTAIGWGAVAGVGACLGILALYRGLATGVMGVVAPIASTSVIVPVVFGLLTGASVPVLCGLGIVIAVIGVVLAGGPHLRDFRTGGHRTVLLAIGAAAGIGVSLVAVAQGSASSAVTTLLVMRLGYLAILIPSVLVRSVPRVPARSVLPLVLLAGAGDVTAVGLYGIATRMGSLPIVAAISSMFPVTTLLLARRLHDERLSREQLVGVIAALLGVVLIVSTQ